LPTRFSKLKSIITSLIAYLDLITSKRQVDEVFFDISSAPGFVPHALLLNKVTEPGLLDCCAK